MLPTPQLDIIPLLMRIIVADHGNHSRAGLIAMSLIFCLPFGNVVRPGTKPSTSEH